MWIRNVPSHSAAWAPHLFPTPGRGGVFPPSSTPEGVCVGARPSPTHAWSPDHLQSGTAGAQRVHKVRTRAPRSCVQGPTVPPARLTAHSHAQGMQAASTARSRTASTRGGVACPRPSLPRVSTAFLRWLRCPVQVQLESSNGMQLLLCGMCVIVSLCYCVTVLLCDCVTAATVATVLLCYCVTVLLCYYQTRVTLSCAGSCAGHCAVLRQNVGTWPLHAFSNPQQTCTPSLLAVPEQAYVACKEGG